MLVRFKRLIRRQASHMRGVGRANVGCRGMCLLPRLPLPFSHIDIFTIDLERQALTLAGKALAIAGPKPFHNAVTPSAAMSFLAQSRKPEYVPCGALCSLDLIV